MKRLDRYVLSYFLSSFALACFSLIGFYLIVDALGKADEFVAASQRLPEEMRSSVPGYVLRYYLLSAPYYYLQFAPFLGLLAVLFTGIRLSKSNELVPMVSSGQSLFRVVVPLFAGAFLVGASMIGVREWMLPRIDDLRDSLRDRLINQRVERIYYSFWMNGLKGERIHCNSFYPASATINDLTVLSRQGNEKIQIQAAEARYRIGSHGIGWYLTDGTRRTTSSKSSEALQTLDFLDRDVFTPEDLLVASRASDNPVELSFAQLNRLSLRMPERRDYMTLLHFFLTFPLMSLILPLLGLPFVLRFEARSSSEGIVIAFLIFFAYFGVDMYLRNLGNQGLLHPLLASWLPVVFFGSLGIILFDSTKT